MSPIGYRFQMLLGHTFVFSDIGLRKKKPLKHLKPNKTLKL